jgi:carbon-monoxide dehydrogenase medium subunit
MPSFIVRPKNLKELWKSLPALPPRRKYLAGGTDLINIANSGSDDSGCWLDISSLDELRAVRETKKTVFIGSAVTISELGNSALVRRWLPALALAIPHFASPSLRNMATLGGNAANASPCADGVCALLAEGAVVCLERNGERRKLPLKDIFLGPKKTLLKKDELITGFEVSKRSHLGAYLKLGPRSYFGISKAVVAVAAELSGGIVKKASVALGSVAPVPLYAEKTASWLAGKKLSPEVSRQAAELVKGEVSPISDVRSEAAYRKEMCGILLERALNSLSRK